MGEAGGGAGWLYRDTWTLQQDLSIEYVIRLDSPQPGPGHLVQVQDVFVSLDQAVRLLTSCVPGAGQVRVRPPNIKTIWTVSMAGLDVDFCPLTEFVYHAALKASGKKFKKVFEGIMKEIVRNLFSRRDLEQSDSIVKYLDRSFSVNDYLDGFGEKAGEAAILMENDFESGWSDMEDLLEHNEEEEVKVEVKLEMESGRERGEEWQEPKSRPSRKTRQTEFLYCGLCSKRYSSEMRLYRHQVTAHPAQPDLHIPRPSSTAQRDTNGNQEKGVAFSCQACSKTFARAEVLAGHCRRDHPDRPELAVAPAGPAGRMGKLETLHERVPDLLAGQQVFPCGLQLCGLRFQRFLSLVEHERTHTESFICILCGLPTHSAENLIAHCDKQHTIKSEFICRVCGFFNRTSQNLKTHVQQEHMAGAVLYQCEECPYTTEKKQSLHNHKRTVHTEQAHYCDVCGKNYASSASLYVHKKSHDPDFKKFQCKLCPSKFAYSSGLSYHMAVHTGEKPFVCPQCGSTFGSHTALSRHVKCEHCGKKFPKRMGREYRDHCKIHTGERDHICSICGSGYFSRKMLRKHELKKHVHLLPKKAQPVRIPASAVPQLTVTPNAARSALHAQADP